MSEKPNVSILEIGEERNKLIVIDNFLEHPDQLIEFANQNASYTPMEVNSYPGIRAVAPEFYQIQSEELLFSVIREAFTIPKEKELRIDEARLSMISKQPKELSFEQRIPHIDTDKDTQFAMVHYLSKSGHGGTSFYRHRKTGYESICSDRIKDYYSKLNLSIAMQGVPPTTYINGNTALFERIASISNVFNRAIIYRSNVLHSGDINPVTDISDDPTIARLTGNMFINLY